MPNRFTLRRLVAIVTALGMIVADAQAIDQLKSFVWTKDGCVTEDAEVDASGQQVVFYGGQGFNGTATFVCVGGTAELDECKIGEAGIACSIAGAFDASAACHGITVTLTPVGTTPPPEVTTTMSAGPEVTTTTEGPVGTSTTDDAGDKETPEATPEATASTSTSTDGDPARRLTESTVTYCFGESSDESSVCSASANPAPLNIGQPKEDHIQDTLDGSSQDWKELTDCPASGTPSAKPSDPSGSVAAKIGAASVLLSLIAAI